MEIKATKPDSPVTLTLTLNTTEARAIRAVCGLISGRPPGPRGLFDDINHALCDAGVPPGYGSASGSIHFPDTWTEFFQQLEKEES